MAVGTADADPLRGVVLALEVGDVVASFDTSCTSCVGRRNDVDSGNGIRSRNRFIIAVGSPPVDDLGSAFDNLCCLVILFDLYAATLTA